MIYRACFLLLTAILLQGCTSEIAMKWEEPLMLDQDYKETKHTVQYRKNNKARTLAYCQAAAESGWYNIGSYQNSHEIYYLKSAGKMFNACFTFDPENYNAYWGWGVVAGMRATQVDAEDAEAFLLQSIKLFKLADRHHVPHEEKNNFYLDWSNAYNGLGAFYAQKGEPEKALPPLEKSQGLLFGVVEQEPGNGRACFLLSANYYYRGDYAMARHYLAKAIEHKFEVPPDYFKDLSEKSSNPSTP